MKIILLQDVRTLGKKGQIVEVNDGYARNYILPKKLGIEANASNINDMKLKNANEEKIAQQQLADAQALADKMKGMSVTLHIKAGEGGKTFGSVSTKEIAEAAAEQCGLEIDKKKVVLQEPIKALGSYEIGVKLHQKVTGKLTVRVTEEK
jgi:large subunit ribosomal protein L9